MIGPLFVVYGGVSLNARPMNIRAPMARQLARWGRMLSLGNLFQDSYYKGIQGSQQYARCPGRARGVASFQASEEQAAQSLAVEPPLFERLMQHAQLTQIAQQLWQHVCRPGDTVIDATCGNGHDTLFLARVVGSPGTVYAFDVQESAVCATLARLQSSLTKEELPTLHVMQQSHAAMKKVVGCSNAVKLVTLNLGYLPGSDKSVTTQRASTLAAIEAACELLRPGGLLSILAYTGHAGGLEEYEAVRHLLTSLPASSWVVSQYQLLNRHTAPILLLAWKQAQVPEQQRRQQHQQKQGQ